MKIKILSLTLMIKLFSLTGFISLPAVQAASPPIQSLQISPAVIKISLIPGQSHNQIITITNWSIEPLPVVVSKETLINNDDDLLADSSAPLREDIIDWLRVTPVDTIIPASASADFTVSVQIPETVPIGGYGALLAFTPMVRGDVAVAAPARIIPRLASVILANVGVPEKQKPEDRALIENLEIRYDNANRRALIDFSIKNTALNFFTAKPLLTLKPLVSFPTDRVRFELTEKIVFPGRRRLWTETRQINTGLFQATLEVSLGEGEIITKSQTALLIPATQFVYLSLFVMTALLIFFFRKKLPHFFKAFFSSP
jgi:hypothetical protein